MQACNVVISMEFCSQQCATTHARVSTQAAQMHGKGCGCERGMDTKKPGENICSYNEPIQNESNSRRQNATEAEVRSTPQHIGLALRDILPCYGRLHKIISIELRAPGVACGNTLLFPVLAFVHILRIYLAHYISMCPKMLRKVFY